MSRVDPLGTNFARPAPDSELPTELVKLVQKAYCAAGDAHEVRAFLSAYADSLGAEGAWLHQLRGASPPALVASCGFEQTWLQRYREYYASRNPYAAAWSRLPPNRTVTMEEAVPTASLLRTEFYNDFILPQGYHPGGLGVPFATDGSAWGLTCHWRTLANAGRLAKARHQQEMVLPHIAAALETHCRFEALQERGADLQSALELSGAALGMCDASGRIVFLSPAAERMVARNDGLVRTRAGKLGSTDRKHSEALEACCRAAVATSHGQPAAALRALPIPRHGGGHYEVLVCPLTQRHAALHDQGARALILIQEPDRGAELGQQLLCDLYGLTAQQARVARLLAMGEETSRIADKLRITGETLKSHLAAIYDKTGTHRQAQLVSRLLSGPARVSRPPAGAV